MSRRARSIGVLALLAMTCASARAHAQEEISPQDLPLSANASSSYATTGHRIPPHLRVRGLPNSAEATPVLYRGAQPTKEGFRKLAKMGIDIVVDLRGSRDSERKIVTRLGMRYVAIPWRCFHPTDEVMARFLKLIRENPGKKIFVHCRTGDDRTGMMIAAYRMAEEGWTPAEARREMEAFGFGFFHQRICPGLASYEQHFPEHFRRDPVFRDLR